MDGRPNNEGSRCRMYKSTNEGGPIQMRIRQASKTTDPAESTHVVADVLLGRIVATAIVCV
jgi:hypothetical protein